MRSSIRKYLIVFMAFIFCFSIIQCFGVGQSDMEVMSKYGSRGEEVRKIQTSLKNWGYYSGEIDGIYGSQTKNSVISFQKKNGLTADGIAGSKTLEAMGIYSNTTVSNRQNDINLLARIASAEARGETYVGQVAVCAVVLNRVKHPSFPNSISGVIYQPGAFSAVNQPQFNYAVVDSAYKAAESAINGWDPTGGCVYYYNPKTAQSSWIRSLPVTTVIGNHVFSVGK